MSHTDHLVMPEDHMDELYNSPNGLVRFAHTARLRAIVAALPDGESLHILDAGCGEGHLLEHIHKTHPHFQLFGIDVVPVALEKARNRCPFATITAMDLTSLAFKENAFDVVACTEVLEHVFEYRKALQEFMRVLKPGGSLIVTFPNEILWTAGRFLLGRRPIKVPDHVNSFSPRKIAKAIGQQSVVVRGLPLGLPFALSLNALVIFTK